MKKILTKFLKPKFNIHKKGERMATKSNRLWAAAALLVAVTGFTACLKSDDGGPTPVYATYFIVNGITTFPTVDMYNNDQKMGSIGSTVRTPWTGKPGINIFKVKKASSDSVMATVNSQYDSTQYSSTLVLLDQPGQGVAIRELRDDYTSYDANKINFRFLQLSPNSPAVDLYFDNVKVDSFVTFSMNPGMRSTFTKVDISNVNTLKVKSAGKDSLLIETSNAQLQKGGVYTLYLGGLKDNTGDRKLVLTGVGHNR